MTQIAENYYIFLKVSTFRMKKKKKKNVCKRDIKNGKKKGVNMRGQQVSGISSFMTNYNFQEFLYMIFTFLLVTTVSVFNLLLLNNSKY